VVFLQQWNTLLGDASNESKILVAVSKDSNPNNGWWHHVIDSKINIGGLDRWADYPGIGVDDKAVYITNNMFSFPGAFGGVRLWIINKAGGAYAGPDNTAAFTVHDPYTAAGSVPTTTQPAHMYGPPGLGAGGLARGTFLVSYSGLTDGVDEYIQIVEVTDPVGAPLLTQQFILVGNIDSGVAFPDAPQSGTVRLIETNDKRALNAVWRGNSLYLCAQINPVAPSPDAGQSTAHWWQVATAVPAPGLTLSDQGNVGAEDLGAATHVYFPTVMVDCEYNMAMGFSASNAGIFVGAYYATRLVGDPPGTIGPTGTLALGVDWYLRTFVCNSPANARNRWGDYSGLSICPVDEATFYVYNEYAGPRGTPTGGPAQCPPPAVPEEGRWHTKLGWFKLKQPVSVAISRFDAFVKDGGVALVGEFRSNLGVETVNVYRGIGEQDLRQIESVFGARESFEFTDRSVTPGTEYRYQIGVEDAEGEFFSPIVKVRVPNVQASLAQNEPNPFNPSTTIRFETAAKDHVQLAVYDANGQLVRTLVDDVRPLGKHEVTWDGRSNAGNPVGSGVYFYRLVAGKFSESRKMVLLK
jgi:hypothetical protein